MNFLYQAYGENNDTFELNRAIIYFFLYYNERKHTTSKYLSYEVIVNRFQNTYFAKVKYNTIKFRKNHKIE